MYEKLICSLRWVYLLMHETVVVDDVPIFDFAFFFWEKRFHISKRVLYENYTEKKRWLWEKKHALRIIEKECILLGENHCKIMSCWEITMLSIFTDDIIHWTSHLNIPHFQLWSSSWVFDDWKNGLWTWLWFEIFYISNHRGLQVPWFTVVPLKIIWKVSNFSWFFWVLNTLRE